MAAKLWIGGYGTTWGNGQNWSPVGYATSSDDATIANQVTITGNGSSNSLTILSTVGMSGIFATGTLNIGNAGSAGVLAFTGGSMIATTATILFGPLQVSGSGTKLTVTGLLTLGGTRSSPSLTANSLVASSGGAVVLGSVSMVATQAGNGITVADTTSTIEVGTAGTAAPGTLTVDSGKSISGQGSLSAANGIVNAGTITAQGGTLNIGGGVSGAGLLQIGAGAVLDLWTGVSSQNVAFTGAGGQLEVIQPVAGTSGFSDTGVIGGFAPGDTILYAGGSVVTSVTYQATGTNVGTLTVKASGIVLGSLTLAGNYTGDTFQFASNSGGYGTLVSVVAPTGGGTANGGSPGTDGFAWISTSSGNWNAVANWQDTSTHVNAAAVPGANNAVQLNGSSSAAPLTISGTASSASLSEVGTIQLSGAFATGAVTVGSQTVSGSLALASSTTLAATSGDVEFGALAANGSGAKLTVSGTLTVGGARGSGTSTYVADKLSLSNGASAQVGGVAMPNSPGGNSISIDATSSMEIGTTGYAVPGTLTIDPGGVLQGIGLITPTTGVVDNGTIGAEGGPLQIGSGITGSGQLVIGGNALLSLYGGTSQLPVSFAGADGTLQLTLTASGALTENGTINGFAPGDTILVASSTPVTTVAYTAGANGTGTLALIDGAATIGTLTLTGNFTGDWFEVNPYVNYGTAITVVPQYPSPDPLFNSAWYLQEYPSVAASGVDPYQDYMTVGWKEGRNPNPWFNTEYYLNQNPDVAAAGVNPLTHYETNGWKEGRDPSILFSTNQYLAANSDVKAAGLDPLLHYVEFGQYEGRPIYAATPHAVGTPDPLVNYAYYYAQHPDVAAEGIDASISYHTVGWQNGWNPDPNYYLTQNPDVKAAGVDPLAHFENYGWKEGREPSLMFNDASYLAANPDVAAVGVDPLVHYVEYGLNEGRTGALTGQGTAPDPLVSTAYYDAQLGATLYPAGSAGQSEATASFDSYGWLHGLSPDAFFDVNYYLSHNPDVAAAGVNPLLHYEEYGWKEGRNPSALFDTNDYLNAYADVKAAGVDPLVHYLEYGQAEGRTAFHV